jgi:GT2 family glycosyltransferase
LSVVIATCANAEATARCVSRILDTEDAGPVEIVVVENRPQQSNVATTVTRLFADQLNVRYVSETRRGLACARNAGLAAARGALVAFTDDDVVVDSRWIRALRDAFADDTVECVTGLIVPAEFETNAQIDLERFAGYAKGFEARIYSIERPPPGEPLFPYAAGHFASGANMAFRTETLRELGGFDPHLGTGTPARGCEDLDICIRLLRAGHRLAYAPSAIVWHRHPDTDAGFRRRVFDYGAALGALLTKHIVLGDDRWSVVSRGLRGARYFINPRSRKNAGRGDDFPPTLRVLELAGLAYGPLAYLISRARARGRRS